jgi:hypothetical protein
MLQRMITALRGERVTATFLVTSPAHTRVRADLYVAGADFSDDRIATFDWSFKVSARRRAWERFARACQAQLLQLEVAPA